jgi:hypothetical protein
MATTEGNVARSRKAGTAAEAAKSPESLADQPVSDVETLEVDGPELTDPDANSDANRPLVDEEAVLDAPEGLSKPEQTDRFSAYPAPQTPSRFWPMVFGGAVTAALGFGAALFLAANYPQAIGLGVNPGVAQRLSDQDKRLSDLAGALAAMPAPSDSVGTDQPLAAAVEELKAAQSTSAADVDAKIAALAQQLADLAKRQDSLTAAIPADGGASVADANAAAEAAANRAKQAEADAAKIKADAAAALQKSVQRAALGELQSAYESGAPIASALAKISETGVMVPQTLSEQAQGVPTLAALRQAFPTAARDALAASLAETAGGSVTSRLTAFLRSQTGARSLTPRAGDDPDAVLSRAEAAVGSGDLATALAEIDALPEQGRARMAEWTGLAGRRQAAGEAIKALAAEIGVSQ